MIAALETHLRDLWPRQDFGPAPEKLHFLKLGTQEYPDPRTALLLLAFANEARTPCAVAKVARDPAGDAAIEAEARALETVAHRLPEPTRRVVPRLLRSGRLNGRSFVLMTSLPGEVELHNTWSVSRARSRSEPMLSALSWALKLAQVAPAEPLRLGEWIAEAQLAAVLEEAETSGWDSALQRNLQDSLRLEENTCWPAGLAHGDYFPGNLLFRRRLLSGVVDWAMASERLPLFFDVLTYEFSFLVQPARGNGTLGTSLLHEVHGLPAFGTLRQKLKILGIAAELGSAPRLASLLGLHQAARTAARPHMSRAFLRILELELRCLTGERVR